MEITDRRVLSSECTRETETERERVTKKGEKETESAASCDIFVSARSGGTPVSLMTVHTNNQ